MRHCFTLLPFILSETAACISFIMLMLDDRPRFMLVVCHDEGALETVL
jgi:hypothetical protein